GVRYYPRLFVTVPVTPVPGRRILVAPGEDRRKRTADIVEAARRLARDERASSAHVLFAADDELADLAAAGMALRQDFQAHWFNPATRDTAASLARGLDPKQRRNARVERSKPAAQGIALRTVRGAELADDRERWGRIAHSFYSSTVEKMRWG